jgi:hypothetical protein
MLWQLYTEYSPFCFDGTVEFLTGTRSITMPAYVFTARTKSRKALIFKTAHYPGRPARYRTCHDIISWSSGFNFLGLSKFIFSHA